MLSTVAGGLDGQVHSESLEVNDHSEDQNGGQQVHQIGKILAVESFTQGTNFVLARSQQVEQRNYSTFEFCASTYKNKTFL